MGNDYPRVFDHPDATSLEPGVVELDCLIVGAGPAGLTAAIYLSRFHRHVLVADAGNSRANLIPLSHNYPGFPPGISGRDLLQRLREQARAYGADLEHGEVLALRPLDHGFEADLNGRRVKARRVILATGIVDELPDMPLAHESVEQGRVRLCAICDGYEVNGDHVAVYGEAHCAIGHGVFLRTFTDRVTVVVHGEGEACEEAVRLAEHYGITLIEDRVEAIRSRPDGTVEVTTCRGRSHVFDIVYPSLGSRVRSALAVQLGARIAEDGSVPVDARQRTSVPGLYAIGDVVDSLKQICVAAGQAAVCATAVHNSLEGRPWRRPPAAHPAPEA